VTALQRDSKALLRSILHPNSSERPSLPDIINHPFFKDTKDDVLASKGKVDFLSMVHTDKQKLLK
jgi:hypothetical protein